MGRNYSRCCQAYAFGFASEAEEWCGIRRSDLAKILAEKPGFTPADVKALFANAQFKAIEGILEDDETEEGQKCVILKDMLQEALRETPPSLRTDVEHKKIGSKVALA